LPFPVATVVPFPVLLSVAAPAHVSPLALEHEIVTALTGGVWQPVNAAANAFTWTVKEEGKLVVLNETFVVAGVLATLRSGSLEVKVTELGVTLALLTVALKGGWDKARNVTATIANFLAHT
jgi:hypothetical protein